VRRFRLLFAAVAAAVLVPTALLARRALLGIEAERRARHESVAERLFDEMERALSEFLAAEEERPFGQYGHEYTPPGQAPGTPVRSPLAESPALPFVIGYFQVDPDGSVRSPLLPQGVDDPSSMLHLSPREKAAVAEIERTVGDYWRAGGNARVRHRARNEQAPGSTLDLDASIPATQAAPRDEKKTEGTVSAYDALRSLNKGAEQRADRQTKITREYGAVALEEPPVGQRAASEAEVSSGVLGDARGGRLRADVARADRFELSPMVGRLIDGRRLMLYRTVVHDTQGYRQGFLIDVEALGAWLRRQALGGSELEAYAGIALIPAAAPAAGPTEGIYLHRFAEPFEELSARLALAPLPGLSGAGPVHALVALLLVATLLGLAALYRTVAVVLRYAEQRSNFVAAVTHELRTPLTAIRMYGEMLRDGLVASEPKRDEYHRRIVAESERLTRLVDNVLELSRLENGARRTQLEAGDPSAVAREAATLVRPHVEEAGFTLRLDVEEGLPPVRFERDALLQMLFNLVDNAVKYADGGTPKEILIACRRDGDDGVRVSVRDHGPGVPSRNLRRIFERFYRAEDELTRRRQGTGLGLALVRGLAEEMGATVSGSNLAEGGFQVEIQLRHA
jgi:signal transduction histidine kinase